MPSHKDPAGLAYLQKIAQLLCDEYDFKREWSHFADSYFLTVCCASKTLTFSFERRLLADPDSDKYRETAKGVLARMLREFPPTPGQAWLAGSSTAISV